MSYASIATGYKGGGVNPRPSEPNQIVTFKPEDLTSAEIGSKTQWFDNRLRFNGDFFVEDYKDLQTPFVPPGSAGSIIINTGHVLLYGVEFDGAATPIRACRSISPAAGCITRPSPRARPGPVPREASSTWRRRFPRQAARSMARCPARSCRPSRPGSSASGVQYSLDLPDDAGTVTPRLDWFYQSTVYFANQTTYVQSTLPVGVQTATSQPARVISTPVRSSAAAGLFHLQRPHLLRLARRQLDGGVRGP